MTARDEVNDVASTTTTADVSRRDFLYIATGAVAVVGTAAFVWPFIDQMNPDASTLAMSTTEVDLTPVAEGQSITVKWRGKPVFIRHRTKKEIDEGKAVKLDQLVDTDARNPNLPEGAEATDANRSAAGKEQWLIMIGVCTHLGCVPIGESGDYDGWFCPCHGSEYDTAGRIRRGPAPENLHIPPYEFTKDTSIRIG